jgi:hypothetical protein
MHQSNNVQIFWNIPSEDWVYVIVVPRGKILYISMIFVLVQTYQLRLEIREVLLAGV